MEVLRSELLHVMDYQKIHVDYVLEIYFHLLDDYLNLK